MNEGNIIPMTIILGTFILLMSDMFLNNIDDIIRLVNTFKKKKDSK